MLSKSLCVHESLSLGRSVVHLLMRRRRVDATPSFAHGLPNQPVMILNIVALLLVVFALLGLWLCYQLGGFKRSRGKARGDDGFYAHSLPPEGAVFWVRFQYDCNDESEFKRLVARMQDLFGTFCEKHLPIPEADAPFFTELTTGKTPSATYAAWPQLRSVRRVCIRSDIGARCWYMSFNHATCGGGDFLRAGGAIVEGEVHDLIEPPRSNVFGLLCCLEWFRWMAFSGNILRPLPPVERLPGGPIEWPRLCFNFPVASCAKPDGEKIKVSTRVRVAHRMLEAIAAGLNGVIVGRPLRVWFAVGFRKQVGADGEAEVVNSVGVIMCVYTPGSTAAELETQLRRNKMHALGSYWLRTQFTGEVAGQQGARGRAWVDVVLSMASVRSCKNLGAGGLRSVFATPPFVQSYPIYCTSLTLDAAGGGETIVYGGVTASVKGFDPSAFGGALQAPTEPVVFPWQDAAWQQ